MSLHRFATVLALMLGVAVASSASDQTPPGPYVGSYSCRECHERFYQLWSTSFHGLAMPGVWPA